MEVGIQIYSHAMNPLYIYIAKSIVCIMHTIYSRILISVSNIITPVNVVNVRSFYCGTDIPFLAIDTCLTTAKISSLHYLTLCLFSSLYLDRVKFISIISMTPMDLVSALSARQSKLWFAGRMWPVKVLHWFSALFGYI
jgi:hypothetical protein